MMDMVVSLLVAQHTSVLHVVVGLEEVSNPYAVAFAGAADAGSGLVALYLPFALLGLEEVLEYYHSVSA